MNGEICSSSTYHRFRHEMPTHDPHLLRRRAFLPKLLDDLSEDGFFSWINLHALRSKAVKPHRRLSGGVLAEDGDICGLNTIKEGRRNGFHFVASAPKRHFLEQVLRLDKAALGHALQEMPSFKFPGSGFQSVFEGQVVHGLRAWDLIV